MKKVYICAPIAGNVRRNIEKAMLYARYTMQEGGAAPVVPHLYAMILDDNIPEQRELGMRAGKSLIWFCDEMWVFGPKRTKGMREEINWCKHLNIPVKYIQDNKINKFKRKLKEEKNNEQGNQQKK